MFSSDLAMYSFYDRLASVIFEAGSLITSAELFFASVMVRRLTKEAERDAG